MELVLSIRVSTKQVFNSISIRQEFITSISRRKTCALVFPLVLKSKHSKQGHLEDMLKFHLPVPLPEPEPVAKGSTDM